jgi:hypothetical protein
MLAVVKLMLASLWDVNWLRRFVRFDTSDIQKESLSLRKNYDGISFLQRLCKENAPYLSNLLMSPHSRTNTDITLEVEPHLYSDSFYRVSNR